MQCLVAATIGYLPLPNDYFQGWSCFLVFDFNLGLLNKSIHHTYMCVLCDEYFSFGWER